MVEIKEGKYRDAKLGKIYEVEVYYSLGGMNYFSGGYNRRGVYVSITPKEVSETGTSQILLSDPNQSGMKMLLQEMPRKSKKTLLEWCNKIKPLVDNMIIKAKESGIKESLFYVKNQLGIVL